MNPTRSRGREALAVTSLALILSVTAGHAAPARTTPARKPGAGSHRNSPSISRISPASSLESRVGVARLEIAPASLVLDGPRAEQHLLVSAALKDGGTC